MGICRFPFPYIRASPQHAAEGGGPPPHYPFKSHVASDVATKWHCSYCSFLTNAMSAFRCRASCCRRSSAPYIPIPFHFHALHTKLSLGIGYATGKKIKTVVISACTVRFGLRPHAWLYWCRLQVVSIGLWARGCRSWQLSNKMMQAVQYSSFGGGASALQVSPFFEIRCSIQLFLGQVYAIM